MPFRSVTKEVFKLRFKWALKVPKIEGEPLYPALSPSYGEWEASERAFEGANAQRLLAEANIPLQVLKENLQSASCARDYLVREIDACEIRVLMLC